ncbi:uncharacterized protein si:ch211-106e7.2 [Ctenopharyngodon idella]|uniref:uncharacterized protein si:ch211-106e7.2 n=1 Tax=Ctenopharyngodon idella TaxID=7959 RepID=UPI00222F7A39|nr:uncharacterized protein si:ch211-106e7.2 [Ctenopharyngodon idella]
MQANSQQSGQLQNLHGKGTSPRDGTANTLGQNLYQLCLPSHAASPSYPGQGATGNYFTQFTCTVQPSTSDQILTSGIQATKDTPLTSKENSGKQDSQIILWNMPSNCQIFLPVNNINLQGAPNNNGPNMPHCAFNSNNSLYIQQQNISLAAGPNNSQQVVNTGNLHSRQQHVNAPNLAKDSPKTRTNLPSDLKYYPPTENAPHGHSSLFGGYHYQLLIPEKSTHANLQTPSTCVQNISAQRAVAVVTPLSPIGTASVNGSDKSAYAKMNVNSVQEIVQDQPNIPHALEANANLNYQKGERNDPISKHVRHQPNIPHALEASANLNYQKGEPNDPARKPQRPKSAEPRLNDGLCYVVGAKSPVSIESTGRSRRASSPKLKSVVAEQNKSVPTQMRNEPSDKINNNCTFTDKKTVETETIPVIEWPLDRLHTLIAMIQQIEDGHQKNVQKNDVWRDILKLYWNGDYGKFYDSVQTGIYQNIMQEVYGYCLTKEPVILRQLKSDVRNKVIKDFHVLKHNEEPPKMTYKSSWLNLNENVDDIDKECGYSWFYKSFQNAPEHDAQISACKTQNKLQEATEKPSLTRCKQLPTAVENKVPAEEPTLDNESLHENLPVLFNEQSPTVSDANCSTKRHCVVTEQTSSQPNIANSLEDMITVVKDLDKKDVQTGMSRLDDQFCSDVGANSVLLPKSTSQSDCANSPKLYNAVAEQREDALSQIQIGSSEKMPNNDCAILDENVRCETFPKPNQEIPVCMNEEETDKVGSSAYKMNVLPHEMAEQRDTSEMMEHNVIAASLNKHETSLLNASQVLNTISMEEQTSRQRLEEKAKKSASTIPSTLLSALYKPSLAEHNDGSTDVSKKVQIEEQTSSEKNMYKESLHEKWPVPFNAHSPPVTDNCSLKLNVIQEQTSCQPNTLNPLNAMKNLVRKLKGCDYLLKKHHNLNEKRSGLTRKHQSSSRTLRLNNSFCNGVGAKSPVLRDESSSQSDCSSPLMLSPVVEKQQEFVSLTQVLNESSDRVRCEIDPKPSQELSVQMNEEENVEMGASASIRINVLPQEVAKQCFAGQLMEDEDIAATAEIRHKASLLRTPQEHDILTKEQKERLGEADGNCSLKGYVVAEQTSCQSNTIHPLTAMTHLGRGAGEKRQIGKCDVLKNKHQPSTAISRLDYRFSNGAKNLALTGSTSQIDCASPPKLHPVTAEPCQMQFNEEMPEIDYVLTDESVRCETDPKTSQELPVQMNEEDIVEMDASVSIRIKVLPQEVAKQCFAGQLMEDQDIAAPPEMHANATSRLDDRIDSISPPKLHPVFAEPSPVQNESNEEMPDIDYMLTDESMVYKTDPKPSQELTLNTNEEETDQMGTLDSIKIDVLSHDMAERWFSGEMEVKDLQKDIAVPITTEDQVKVQVLELKPILLEDVKPKEGKYHSSGDEMLESYCCLAKWFQTLEHGDGPLCMCQKKAEFKEEETQIEVHGTSLELQTEKEDSNKLVELENSTLERTDDSETTDDENPLSNDPTWDTTKILKDVSSSEEVRKMETEMSEQTRDESPAKCATNVTMKNEIEQDIPTPDLKRKTNTICLALYGSSSGRKEVRRSRRSKGKEICEEPPETLQVTILSHHKFEAESKSKKHKEVETQDEDVVDKSERIRRASSKDLALHRTLPSHPVSELSKNALSSTSIKKLLNPSANAKSGVHLGGGNKRKRQHKCSTQQMSMNKYVIRGKTVPYKLLHSPDNITKSKYELGNPALLPLEEGLALEFKVLPESFNFEDGPELNCAQADTSQSTQNEMSGPEDKVKRMKTSRSPTQGVWSFSPLKKKQTQPIQVADVSGSCSLFQEFKKRYHKKKEIASKQNSSERA